jgi:hypothetical protein
VREVDKEGSLHVKSTGELVQEKTTLELLGPELASPARRIYPFGISRRRLEQALRQTGSGATLAEHLHDADLVVTLRNYYRRKLPALREAEARGVPIYVLKSNTVQQMEQALFSMREGARGPDPMARAMAEAEEAALSVSQGDPSVELSPQNAYIRRLQHQLAQRYNVTSRSLGREPHRRVRMSRDDDRRLPFAR